MENNILILNEEDKKTVDTLISLLKKEISENYKTTALYCRTYNFDKGNISKMLNKKADVSIRQLLYHLENFNYEFEAQILLTKKNSNKKQSYKRK